MKRSAPNMVEEEQQNSITAVQSHQLSCQHTGSVQLPWTPARQPLARQATQHPEIFYGCHEEIGHREHMEDRHVKATLHFTDETLLMVGVFDGHGGDKVAEFVSSNAELFVMRELQNAHQLAADTVAGVPVALHRAYVALDVAAAHDVRSGPLELEEMGGSTALVVVCSEDKVICANCGDSRAVLARGGCEVVPLSHDHKPDREDELVRIHQAGGRVLCHNGGPPRVMGILAMSRAIGDSQLQQYGVTPVPEVQVVNRSSQDEFLILASDGLWGVMSNQDAVTITRRCLQRAASKGATRAAAVHIAAKVLARAAASRGNTDNITIIVLDLRDVQQGRGSGSGQHARAGQHASEAVAMPATPSICSVGSTQQVDPSPLSSPQASLDQGSPPAPVTPTLISPCTSLVQLVYLPALG